MFGRSAGSSPHLMLWLAVFGGGWLRAWRAFAKLSAKQRARYATFCFLRQQLRCMAGLGSAYDGKTSSTCFARIEKPMAPFRPKYVTFDCYGTLINFQMAEAARDIYGAQLDAAHMDEFVKNFSAYRLDEVLGDWKPYAEVVHNAIERTCKKNGVTFRDEDAKTVYERVPTWGPHADVPAGLAKVAKEIPLVILSNAMNSQIMSNVEKLGAPFHAVYTAEQAQSYKPRMKGFEYMFDMLGCGPEDITHVSSSFRYDLMTAHDLGIKSKVWVNRGHEPANPYYGYQEIADISGLAGVFGL
jgi:2-haloacid dehalogenase